jgi:hypothetical protein
LQNFAVFHPSAATSATVRGTLDNPLPAHDPGGNVAAMQFFLVGLAALAILVFIAVRLLRGRIPTDPLPSDAGQTGKLSRIWAASLKAASVPPDAVVTGAASSEAGTLVPGARNSSDIGALAITLDVNRKPSLFLMLAADGAVNRMGSGTLEDSGGQLFVGKTDPAIFETVRSHVTEAMLELLGKTFQDQNRRGVPCKLTLTFQFKDGTWNGFGFLYRSESEGMRTEVADYVTAAVRQTDPWYENCKRSAAEKQP